MRQDEFKENAAVTKKGSTDKSGRNSARVIAINPPRPAPPGPMPPAPKPPFGMPVAMNIRMLPTVVKKTSEKKDDE
jgi:hypothetical protein